MDKTHQKGVMLGLLQDDWGQYSELLSRLKAWEHYALLLSRLGELRHDALYKSPIHGLGHIERTMLFGAIIAMEEGLNAHDTEILLLCCSYHDVGRINDFWDTEHGGRSALKIEELTGLAGEDLKLAQAAVEAHSIPDAYREDVVARYNTEDFERAMDIAGMLKDADGLDRVRISDLDPIFLRRKCSPKYENFAYAIYDMYKKAEEGSKSVSQ